MFFVVIGILFLGVFFAFKVLKGVIKLVLILLLVGLLVGSFANKDKIDAVPVGTSV